MAGGLLAAILDRLSSERPRIAFQVKLGDAAMLHYHDLRERNVDLLFARMVDPKEGDMNAEILFEDRLYVVAGNNNPWTRRRRIALKDLVSERWVIPPPDYYVGALIVEAFKGSGLASPHFAVTGYGVELQTTLIATGRFLSVLPGSFLRFSGKRLGLKALPIELPLPPRPVGIVTLQNRTVSPLAQLFIDCARDISKPLAAKAHKRSVAETTS